MQLPDYIIYDELKREREKREERDRQERPRLEIPRHIPYWPEEEAEEDTDRNESDRGVVILEM